MTWPQARHLSTQVPDADDPLLSVWRISWIAHALPTTPADLLNGNIFYPEQRTLAYTDSVLLQGFAAAPAIWAGVAPIVVYNLLILASIALSGAAMWLYARRLTGSGSAAVLAGIAFSFVPFRFDHFQHLELQATMFMPLTLWCLARAFDTGARRDLWGAVACLVAQVYCGIYYAVFLLTALLIVIPIELRALPAERRRALVRASVPALAILALAALAAVGWARLEKRLKRGGGTPFLVVPVATAIVAAAMLLEYATPLRAWFVVPPTPQVYRWLADQPRPVVLELPVSTADWLDIVPDGLYMFRSTEH